MEHFLFLIATLTCSHLKKQYTLEQIKTGHLCFSLCLCLTTHLFISLSSGYGSLEERSEAQRSLCFTFSAGPVTQGNY